MILRKYTNTLTAANKINEALFYCIALNFK